MKPAQRGVFISYRGADTDFAPALLHQTLSRRFGRAHVFLDAESISPGEDYVERLLSGVRSSAVLLAVIGPQWLTTADSDGRRLIDNPHDWIRRELETAFAAGVTVIPIFTDSAIVPTPAELPPGIAALGRNQGQRLHRRDYRRDLDGIVHAIKKAAPDLVDLTRRRALLVSIAAVAVAGAVALSTSLVVNHQGGSPTGPAAGSSNSAQPGTVLWHGPVTLDSDKADTNWSLDPAPEPDIGLACRLCDPPWLMGFGGLAIWRDPTLPEQHECADLMANADQRILDIAKGTVACLKTTKNRIGYLKVLTVSTTRVTLDVTIWDAPQ